MILTTVDYLLVNTSTTSNIDVQSSWTDISTGVFQPGKTSTQISSVSASTTIVASPSTGVRQIKTIVIRNKHMHTRSHL